MLRAFVSASPWDLIDDDLDGGLDRLHGEVGVTGVSLWAVAPPLVELRTRPINPRVFHTRGGAFFHPEGRYYDATRCKPIASARVKSSDPIARIRAACVDRKMDVRLMVSAGAAGRMAERYPEMACKNVFRAVSTRSLCLSNPDVQVYLIALVTELSARYSPSAIVLTDFLTRWGEADVADLRVSVPLGETGRMLLGLCFCESCRQRAAEAGVDAMAAGSATQANLQRMLEVGGSIDAPPANLLAENQAVSGYVAWRNGELTRLLRRLVEACQAELLIERPVARDVDAGSARMDYQAASGVVTFVDDPAALEEACSGKGTNEIRVPARLATGSHASELVSLLAKGVELGITGVQFDSYGLLSDDALVPIKQAIRFARRSTSGS